MDLARDDTISWNEAIEKFDTAKRKVLLLREDIKKDQKLLSVFYKERENLAKRKWELKQLTIEKEQLNKKLNEIKTELESNEKETLEQEEEIKYIQEHSSVFKKLLILLGLGKIGRHVAEKQKYVEELIIKHEDIKRRYSLAVRNTEEVCGKIENQYSMIEAWGRGFEKIREACVLYDGPLPEYEINEAGIMVLCKACDKYLGLLRNDGQHPDHYPNQNGQDLNKQIIDFCKEPKSVQEIMDEFYFDSRTSFRRKYLTPMLKNGVLKMTIPEKPSSKNQKYFS